MSLELCYNYLNTLFREFKDKLKQSSSTASISQATLSKIAEIHVTNISRYERGENKPTTQALSKLANTLGRTTDYLMSDSSYELVNDTISYKELLSIFKKVNMLSADKKKTVKKLLEAFVFIADIQQKLA